MRASPRASPASSWSKPPASGTWPTDRSEEHTSELQSHHDLVCRLLLEKNKVRQQHLLSRSAIGCRFLYTSMDSALRRRQTLSRRAARHLPVAWHFDALHLPGD